MSETEPEVPSEEPKKLVVKRGLQLLELDNGNLVVRPIGGFASVYEIFGWVDALFATSERIKNMYMDQVKLEQEARK